MRFVAWVFAVLVCFALQGCESRPPALYEPVVRSPPICPVPQQLVAPGPVCSIVQHRT